jgi:hypothetical protein
MFDSQVDVKGIRPDLSLGLLLGFTHPIDVSTADTMEDVRAYLSPIGPRAKFASQRSSGVAFEFYFSMLVCRWRRR